MSSTIRNTQSTYTDIAVLQVQVTNIENTISEVKTEIRNVQNNAEKSSHETQVLLREIQKSSDAAHKELSKKISTLEKWRYMIMGAGIAIGNLGFHGIAKLFNIS